MKIRSEMDDWKGKSERDDWKCEVLVEYREEQRRGKVHFCLLINLTFIMFVDKYELK